MKPLYTLLLAIILTACNRPVETPTPSATVTAAETSTPSQTPSITPTLWAGEHLLPAGFDSCVWTSNQDVMPLYNEHYSGSVSTLVIVYGTRVQFTGHYTDFVWDIGKFAEVSAVDGDPLHMWVRLTNEDRSVYYFETEGDCTLQAKPLPTFTIEAPPTEEVPQASATPAPQIWSLLQSILPTGELLTDLNVRQPQGGVCVSNGTIVGRLAFDENNEANNRFALSAESWDYGGTEYHVILGAATQIYVGKCVAVRTKTLTFMVKVG